MQNTSVKLRLQIPVQKPLNRAIHTWLMKERNSLNGVKKTAYSKSVTNSPYTQAMERSPMDQLLHISLGLLCFSSSIFSIFHKSLLARLFTGMLFISLTSPRNLWMADISKKRLEGYKGRRGRALSTNISISIGLISGASV